MISMDCQSPSAQKTVADGQNPVGTPGLRLEIVREEDEFLALEPCWDRLLDKSAIRTPFLRWDWVSLWWQQYRDRFKLAVGVLRDGDHQPRGIAPFVIGRDFHGLRRHLRHLTFLGGMGEIMSEGMDLIVPAGLEPVYSPRLCQVIRELRREWDIAKLPMIAEESPNRGHLFEALQCAGCGANVLDRRPSRVVDLPPGWHEMEMRLSSNRRSFHRRKWKAWIHKSGGTAVASQPGMMGEARFEQLLELHAMRWGSAESQFLCETTKRFHRALVSRWWPQGRIVMPSLDVDGRPAAMTYNFVDDGKFWYYQAGRDPKLNHLSLGKLALGWSIQVAIQMGLRQFDFLPGDNDIKSMWTDQVRYLEDFESFARTSFKAGLFRAVRAIKRAVRRGSDIPPGETPDSEAGL